MSILRTEGISSEFVLRAVSLTPRHLFVPDEVRSPAYRDHPLPIGHGQTISQPFVVAYMTESVLAGDETAVSKMRVLEIGTGSGYQAAILAELVKEVYTIEIIPALADRARRLLTELGHLNVSVRAGDGYKGWPEKAPFDAIVVTAAPPRIPEELVRELAPGGRMCLPLGETSNTQTLVVVAKSDTGAVSIKPLLPVRFVPMVPEKTYK